ncbi:MAG: ABC transporter ATP-binding protein [Spirochaetia bacterium]
MTIEGLSFSYPLYPGLEAAHLFDKIDLTLPPQELRVVLGSPESGKTTLSRILTGFIPRYFGGVLEGEVRLGETDISSTPPSHLIDRIGTIFQDPDEQIFTTSCESEVAFPLESLGLERKEILSRVEEGLTITQLESFKGRSPGSLSGGEKKKLLFAVLFALRPRFWILDEPFDEMDYDSSYRILSNISKGGYGVLLFASKVLDIFEEFPLRYGLLWEKQLLLEEDTGREELIHRARSLGLAFERSDNLLNGSSAPRVTPKSLSSSAPLLSASDLSFSYEGAEEAPSETTESTKRTEGAAGLCSEEPEGIEREKEPEGSSFSLDVKSLEIYPGERIALVGPNGCGKTTLAKLLCGLLLPNTGTVRGIDSGPLESQVAYIFQNPDYQIFLSTVEDELSYGLKELGLPREDIRSRVEEASRRFKLPSLNVPPTMMSYGARKRLQAAVYYLLERRVYIIDEADSGLSLRDFSNMVDALSGEDRALVIITHNKRMGQLYSDRTLCMERGKLIRPKAGGKYDKRRGERTQEPVEGEKHKGEEA